MQGLFYFYIKTCALMINYTPQSQLSLELFKHPFDTHLDKDNRWVQLAALDPWDELAAVYSKNLQDGSGRMTVDIRIVIAAIIIKHKLRLDDRGTILMIKENIYLQYFCGLKSFTTKAVFDPSLFVDIRKRLGGEEFDKFNKLVIDKSENIKPHQARIKRKPRSDKSDKQEEDQSSHSNRGTLKVDATVADQEIRFPTDVNLLNTSREILEQIIDLMYKAEIDGTKPRTYRRVARKKYLNFSKKKRKSNKVVRSGIKAQLQYVGRDLKIINQLMNKTGRQELLSPRDKNLLQTIIKVYEQQKWMYDNKTHSCHERIVNIFQPWVRPIVRGKDKNKTEFGAKINVSEVDGFCRIDRLSWEAYNESTDLVSQVENFKTVYGCYPKVLLGDKIYLTRENRRFLKEKGIEIHGKPLGRPPKTPTETSSARYRKRKKAAQRNHIEAKFGQGKRAYGLNNIKARLAETSESWINAIIFVMNLTKLLQLAQKYPDFFVPFLKWLESYFKTSRRIFSKHFLYPSPVLLVNLA
jgi:hypothetical protein